MASIGAAARTLSYREARLRILSAVPVLPAETVPLARSLGRALRRRIIATHPLPPFTNTSMDGYAVRAADLEAAREGGAVDLPVVEVIPAGSVASRALAPGTAMRIMTGAPMPPGADAVVPFEDSERTEYQGAEWARFRAPVAHRANVRSAGADLEAGAEALAAGRAISPHDLALLASLGESRIEVGRRPRVAILSTGDELLRVDEALRPGAIRDSNVPLLEALLAEAGAEVVGAERVADRPGEVARRASAMLEAADVVLTIGGVSAGDFDPVKLALADLGPIELWRVAMKPGRPQAFGVVGGKVFHGLPGNPASVACVFEALTRPALRAMQGFSSVDRPRMTARAAEPIESRAGRTDFVRVTLERRGDDWWASSAGVQVSGHLTPQSRAHALLVVPEVREALATGEHAEALILRWPEATAS